MAYKGDPGSFVDIGDHHQIILFESLHGQANGKRFHVVGNVEFEDNLILSSCSALNTSLSLLTSESFTYKLDCVRLTAQDIDSFLNVPKCVNILHP